MVKNEEVYNSCEIPPHDKQQNGETKGARMSPHDRIRPIHSDQRHSRHRSARVLSHHVEGAAKFSEMAFEVGGGDDDDDASRGTRRSLSHEVLGA